jgi:hypothetical protein
MCTKLEAYRSGKESDVTYLKNIYRYDSGEGSSDGPAISGWIKNLFLMGSDNEFLSFRDDDVSTAVLPTGITQVPFVWQYYDERVPMECYAGFDDPLINVEERSVETRMAFAIAESRNA